MERKILSKYWLFAVLMFFISIPLSVFAESWSGGQIDFNIAAPEGKNAKIDFSGVFSGNGELNVDASVFSTKESVDITENGNPAGKAYSAYSDAELSINGGADGGVKLDFFGSSQNKTEVSTQYATGSAEHKMDFGFSGKTCSAVDGNVKISGWTAVNHSQDQRYMGAETSSTATVSGNLPISVSNSGSVNVTASDQIGNSYVNANGYAGYNTGVNTTGFARSETGTWMTQDANRMSVTAFVRSRANETQANNH